MSWPEGGRIPQPYHHAMLANHARMGAFKAAISRVVGPGDKVLEAGAGTGILSALAARAGASRVDAVEWDPTLVALSRQVLSDAGLAQTVTVHEGSAEAFLPPHRPDVVICEMLHVGLINERQVPVLRSLLGTLDGEPPRVIPYAAVNALQLLQVDFHYEGIAIPMIRACPHGVEDPRLEAISQPETYWVCRMASPEPAVNERVTLTAARPGLVNAVAIVTKAVMTPDFEAPDNEWYLQQLIIPVPPRHLAGGETAGIRIAYEAGCAIEAVTLSWADGR